jgi:hypothetical protein
VAVAVAALAGVVATAAAAAVQLPKKWPRRFAIGLSDAPGHAASLRVHARVTFRYQYLTGGLNTGSGWATWNPNGAFVTYYVRESARTHTIPVFSYYQLQQSHPGTGMAEDAAIRTNLRTTATMRAFYNDLALLFRRAAAFPRTPVVVQLEPDMWGYVEQSARGDDARTVPARTGSTGISTLRGLPENAAGVAQAVVRLRDRIAPNVILGLHLSIWGTRTDIGLQDPPNGTIDRLARRSARFYRSLGARYDVLFTDVADRDADFDRLVRGDGGASWWKAADYGRFRRYAQGLTRATRLPLVVWQIPLGNTLMRSVNDTWGHYADNRVQGLLGVGMRPRLVRWRAAGIVALLFGGGADGTTCACDARHDGVTNPPPIGRNTRRATSADDDGGYFAARARAYARNPLVLRG